MLSVEVDCHFYKKAAGASQSGRRTIMAARITPSKRVDVGRCFSCFMGLMAIAISYLIPAKTTGLDEHEPAESEMMMGRNTTHA